MELIKTDILVVGAGPAGLTVTALSGGVSTISALMQVVGPDHVLFGSDLPIAAVPAITRFGEVLDELSIAGFSLPDVYARNAARLLNRDRQLHS